MLSISLNTSLLYICTEYCSFTYDQLFLEFLLTEIRGKTISYATFKKRERVKLENTLTRDIRKLEENAQYQQQHFHLLPTS
jgi:hypothetical protein